MSKFEFEKLPGTMTPNEAHIDKVKTNLLNCKRIVLDAEICNKGIHAHEINQKLSVLKSKVRAMEKKRLLDVDKEDIFDACKYMQCISSLLWLANRANR